jgi:hypothetical protein
MRRSTIGISLDRRPKGCNRLIIALQSQQCSTQREVRIDVVRTHVERLAETGYRFLEPASRRQQPAKRVARLGKIGIGGERGTVVGDRFVRAIEFGEQRTQAKIRLRVRRFGRKDRFVTRNCSFMTPQCLQTSRQAESRVHQL